MNPDALRKLASQLRRNPDPDVIEATAAALDACALEQQSGDFACHWTSHPDRAYEADGLGKAGFLVSNRPEDCEAIPEGNAWRIKRTGLEAWLTRHGALVTLVGSE